MFSYNIMIYSVFLIQLKILMCKDLSENERVMRAAFIQKLLNKQKYAEGRIKLMGGQTSLEGNVYINHAGRWGAICDDSWDHAAAQVVCRMFNKTGVATHGGQYGEAIEKFWMNDVVCEGYETSLSKCIFSGWGSSDCNPSEAAGVKCGLDIPPMEIKSRPRRPLHEVMDVLTASLRLVGGRSSYEGRVEIYYGGKWGSICPDGWTLYEASAVCRHLALGFAEQALQTDFFGSSKIVLSGVDCEGNETNLFSCRHREFGNHLSDLLLDTNAIERSAHLQDAPMFQLQCAMEENCLSKSAYEVAVNPHARIAEQTFHNNAASCSLRLTDTYAAVYA
ncbi:unnamed protein product, partial [Leptidea sinapis]